MGISEAVRILSDGAPLKGFEPPPTSARIQVAWGASTFQSPRRGGNPPAGFFPFPVTCFFRFPKPISETLTRPKRRFRRGSATTRSCSRSLSERNRCLFQEFVKFLDLISVVGDTRDGTEQTFCDGVTAGGGGEGQKTLFYLVGGGGRAPRHVGDRVILEHSLGFHGDLHGLFAVGGHRDAFLVVQGDVDDAEIDLRLDPPRAGYHTGKVGDPAE